MRLSSKSLPIINRGMKQFYPFMSDLDLELYLINYTEYDPIHIISKFWRKYDLGTFYDRIVELGSVYMGNSYNCKPKFGFGEMRGFMKQLIRISIAYYITHTRRIELSNIDLSAFANNRINEEDIRTAKIIYGFFERFGKIGKV